MTQERAVEHKEDQQPLVVGKLISAGDELDEVIKRIESESDISIKKRPINERLQIVYRSLIKKFPRRKSYTEKLVDKLYQHPEVTAENRYALLKDELTATVDGSKLNRQEISDLRKLVMQKSANGGIEEAEIAKLMRILKESEDNLRNEKLVEPKRYAETLRKWSYRCSYNSEDYLWGGTSIISGGSILIGEGLLLVASSPSINLEYITNNPLTAGSAAIIAVLGIVSGTSFIKFGIDKIRGY